MNTLWLFAQNSTSQSACPHAQITLANDEEPTLCCRSCGKRWTFVPADGAPVVLSAARVVELETELAELRDLAFAIHADIELAPEQLEVKRRLIADRYQKQAAKAKAACAESWTTAQRAGVAIVRCKHCGFEAFPFADATIGDHMKACAPEVQQ